MRKYVLGDGVLFIIFVTCIDGVMKLAVTGSRIQEVKKKLVSENLKGVKQWSTDNYKIKL